MSKHKLSDYTLTGVRLAKKGDPDAPAKVFTFNEGEAKQIVAAIQTVIDKRPDETKAKA